MLQIAKKMPKCMWPHAPYCSAYFGGFTYQDGVYYCSTHQQAATAPGARAPPAPAAPRPGHEESRRAQRVYEESCRSVEMALDAGEDQMDLDEGEDQPGGSWLSEPSARRSKRPGWRSAADVHHADPTFPVPSHTFRPNW